MSQAQLPPGPKGNLLLNKKFDLKNGLLEYLEQDVKQYPKISRGKVGPFWYVNISEPDYIEHVFTNRDIYIKGRDNDNLKFLLGNGLLTNTGDFWMKQRRLMQPIFHKQRLQGFVQKIAESTNNLLSEWEGSSQVDVHSSMTKLTLDIVGQTLMSANVSGEFKKVTDAVGIVMEGMIGRTRSFVRLPYWLPTERNIAMKKNRAILDETIRDIINNRRADTKQYDDLLTMLLEVEDADTAERMTDDQLRDEVITIFLAGHETTANALAFAFYLLAKHPEASARIASEVKTIIGGAELSYEQLNKLEYTTMVVKEAMRLYPPAWGIVRQAAKDDVIDGYKITKGDTIVLSPYAVQRNERVWAEPEKFDPERFSAERGKAIHRYAWFPFGGGARLCIGNNFAMMEMQIIVALLCSKYSFKLPDNFKLELEPLVTLRPKGELPLLIEKLC